MMQRLLVALAAFIILTVPLSAFAGIWTAQGIISNFEDYGVGAQLRVANDAGTGTANPASCSQGSTRWLLADPALSAAQIDRLHRTALAAYLGGRQVQVKVNSTSCSSDGFRLYYAISIVP